MSKEADHTAALLAYATSFRAAIQRTIDTGVSPHLPYFPEGACRLVSRLLALDLQSREPWRTRHIEFVSGHFPDKPEFARHVWLRVDDSVVDLTADPFGENPVVVGNATPFHASLDTLEAQSADDALKALSADELARLKRLLEPIRTCMTQGE